jgi:hypothetical protein
MIVERLTYFTPDNVEFMLSSPWYVIQEDGFGMPPLEFVTQRGPFQHGEIVKSVWLRPRIIQLLVRREACSRSEYWDLRAALINTLRPNRTTDHTPGRLRKYLANGQVRELFAYPSEGPSFPSHDPNEWQQFSVQDTIRFTCYDPVARDPTVRSRAYISSGPIGLFPITFPYAIGSFGASNPIVYSGNWDTFPTIVINGPATGTMIKNLTTGEQISFSYSIPSGHSATFDLAYGRKTVTLDDGTNVVGYVTSDSDLGAFHLQSGSNDMQIFATGTSAVSSVVLSWYDRYIGV